MKGKDYEDLVALVVAQLDLPANKQIAIRTTLTGVRQPGEYEIDIAVRFRISDALDFLLIVECKGRQRPVDRPVVQNLIQTRDAVAAQKAVLVSHSGFTSEAVDVAKSENIALWIVAEGVFRPIAAYSAGRFTNEAEEMYDDFRGDFIEALGLQNAFVGPGSVLVPWHSYPHKSTLQERPSVLMSSIKHVPPALEELAAELYVFCLNCAADGFQPSGAIWTWHESAWRNLAGLGLTRQQITMALMAVAQARRDVFLQTASSYVE